MHGHAAACVCTQARTTACVRECLRACVRACLSECVSECVRACVRACARACVRACTCVRDCLRACVRACVHMNIACVACAGGGGARCARRGRGACVGSAVQGGGCVRGTARSDARRHKDGVRRRLQARAIRQIIVRIVPTACSAHSGRLPCERTTVRKGKLQRKGRLNGRSRSGLQIWLKAEMCGGSFEARLPVRSFGSFFAPSISSSLSSAFL
eukprot:6199367-Pleurochrysis_carterae.AAC.1